MKKQNIGEIQNQIKGIEGKLKALETLNSSLIYANSVLTQRCKDYEQMRRDYQEKITWTRDYFRDCCSWSRLTSLEKTASRMVEWFLDHVLKKYSKV